MSTFSYLFPTINHFLFISNKSTIYYLLPKSILCYLFPSPHIFTAANKCTLSYLQPKSYLSLLVPNKSTTPKVFRTSPSFLAVSQQMHPSPFTPSSYTVFCLFPTRALFFLLALPPRTALFLICSDELHCFVFASKN